LRKTLIITIAFIFAAALNFSFAQVKVAYVDSEVIIKQLPEAQEVSKQLEALQKQYVDTISAKEGDLKLKADAFKTKYEDAQKQAESGTLTPDQLKTLESELGAMQVEIQRDEQELYEYKQGVQQILINTQGELFKPVKEKIIKVIEQVAKELKYNFVLDKAGEMLLYGDKEMDLTFKVLDKLK
jgi:outer membrane protein